MLLSSPPNNWNINDKLNVNMFWTFWEIIEAANSSPLGHLYSVGPRTISSILNIVANIQLYFYTLYCTLPILEICPATCVRGYNDMHTINNGGDQQIMQIVRLPPATLIPTPVVVTCYTLCTNMLRLRHVK